MQSGAERNLLADWNALLRHIAAEAEHSAAVFGRPGDVIVLIQPARVAAEDPAHELIQSAWAEVAACAQESTHTIDTLEPDRVVDVLGRLREKNFLTGEERVGRGGLAAALARACGPHSMGFDVNLAETEGVHAVHALFGERTGRAVVTCRSSAHLALANFVDRSGWFTAEAIGRVTGGRVSVRWMGAIVLETDTRDLLRR